MARHNKFTTTSDELRDLYAQQHLSVEQIAEKCGCKTETIRFYLNKYGITNFSRGGQVVLTIDKDVLEKLYHEEKLGMPEIAKSLGCGETTVFRKIHEYGLAISDEEVQARKTAHNTARRAGWSPKRLSGGYTYTKRTDHPLANTNGYVSEHRVNAEAAMGRSLKDGERIHHISLDKRDNSPTNLAVLPSQAAHLLLHRYLDRCGAFLCGLNKVRPEPLDFGRKVFWGGRWVTQIDLIPAEPHVSFAQYDSMFAAASPPSVN